MKMPLSYPVVFLTLGLLAATGCAKKELVKKDEMIPPAAMSDHAGTKPANTAVDEKSPASKQSDIENVTENPSTGQLQSKLDSIYFNFDSAGLESASRDTLAKTYKTMEQRTGIKVRIEGNCDERGSEEYNIALGEKRANAAKKYLSTMGIDAARLSTISYGKDKPADPAHDEAAWKKNRRDDFVIVSR
jgi:peptidoglycan-associated lipoprotein